MSRALTPLPQAKRPFSPFYYKYFFRTCAQTGVTIQKYGFNKKKIQGMLKIFNILSEKMRLF